MNLEGFQFSSHVWIKKGDKKFYSILNYTKPVRMQTPPYTNSYANPSLYKCTPFIQTQISWLHYFVAHSILLGFLIDKNNYSHSKYSISTTISETTKLHVSFFLFPWSIGNPIRGRRWRWCELLGGAANRKKKKRDFKSCLPAARGLTGENDGGLEVGESGGARWVACGLQRKSRIGGEGGAQKEGFNKSKEGCLFLLNG